MEPMITSTGCGKVCEHTRLMIQWPGGQQVCNQGQLEHLYLPRESSQVLIKNLCILDDNVFPHHLSLQTWRKLFSNSILMW